MVLLILLLFPTVTLSDEGSPSHRHFYEDPEMHDVGILAGDKVSVGDILYRGDDFLRIFFSLFR